MPNGFSENRRTINVEAGQLPPPATKLIITQVLKASQDPPFWAWIIVGAFYDSENRILWSTELFAAHLDIQFESDEEQLSEAEAEEEEEEEEEEPGTLPCLALYPDTGTHPSILRQSSRCISSHTPSPTMSGGWNPLTGRDSGSGRPAFAPYGAPQVAQGQAYIPHAGGPGYAYGTVPQPSAWPSMTYGYYPLGGAPGVPQYAVPGYPPFQQAPAAGFYTQQSFSYQPNGTGNMLPRHPQPYPNIDSTMPAAQMTNTTGGTGCEPGYNYFFPAEHTKAHIFKTNTPPWQLPPTAQIPFKAAHIPCNTTMAELLKGFGCTNATPKKNRCFEVVSGGGGKWYKGLEVNGADKDMLKKTIKDVGWDATRTGNPNEKPVVCLWFCRD
ncbi:uncharacterized protein TRIREDRAFT_111418 [Trichoderma reesei QM6a]|uniref:Predicted protein n=1 Tax=Hypocrea jecorina (strain QM6a) TaxID=431241 RepID=G0RUI5_HYPJQ|nr:uncharacterized protein TRIREDRAFT_111418 [Trichoderma reesei QM6a]EGR45201.1 predicted protein [Trichoderma reesei QM6a]